MMINETISDIFRLELHIEPVNTFFFLNSHNTWRSSSFEGIVRLRKETNVINEYE